MSDTRSVPQSALDAALPNVTATLSFGALDAPVTVYRDTYGIPHVKATTAHDAFFGQGFAAAQDRLFQMDHDRRWAYGRWAELAGESAVEQDVLMRKFQLRHSVERDYGAVNAETRTMFEAYAEGVNGFIETTGALPVEYEMLGESPEAWTPLDCLAVFKARHVLMGHMEAKLWRARMVAALGAERAAELMPQYEEAGLLIVPPGAEYIGDNYDVLGEYVSGAEHVDGMADSDSGSNNWAVHGSRTESGKPLVAGDPHRPIETPSVYYQNHIACDEFDAMGLSFPGYPAFPHFGHNARVAWCVTHAAADYQDLYIEAFRGEGSLHYEYKGSWKHAETHTEVIRVRGAEPVEIEVTTTHHGPIVVGEPNSGRAIAFKYTATHGANTAHEALLLQLRSRSVDEMDEAMRGWVDPCNNYVFGDVDGDVAYLTRGKVPVRSMANAWLPVPGWTGEHEWEGFIPFEEMPRIRNPENGFIVTANNKQVDDDYPYYISVQYATEHRARRIYDRLKEIAERHGRGHGRRSRRAGVDSGTCVPEASRRRRTRGRAFGRGEEHPLGVGREDGRGCRRAGAIQRVPLPPRRHGHPRPPGAAGRLCAERGRSRGSPPGVAAQGPTGPHGGGRRRFVAAERGDMEVGHGRGARKRRRVPQGQDRQRHERVDVGGRRSIKRTDPTGWRMPTPGQRNWKALPCRSAGTAIRLSPPATRTQTRLGYQALPSRGISTTSATGTTRGGSCRLGRPGIRRVRTSPTSRLLGPMSISSQ